MFERKKPNSWVRKFISVLNPIDICFNPFMHNVVEWPNIIQKSFGVKIFKVCLAILQHA